MIIPSSSPTASHRASWSEPVLPLPPVVDHSTTASLADTGGSKTPIADLFRVDITGKPPKGVTVASGGSGSSASSTANRGTGFSSSMARSVDALIVAPILNKKPSEMVIGRGSARGDQTPKESLETGVDDSSASPWVSGAPRLSVQRGSKNSSNEDWATSVLIAAHIEPRHGV